MDRVFEHKGMVLHVNESERESLERAGPAGSAAVRAPGAGQVEIGRLALSVDVEGLELTARVTGKSIAYIYAEVLLEDSGLDRFYGPVAREHVRSVRHTQSRGVTLPDWDDPVGASIRFRPSLRVLTDGLDSAFCFSTPESYDSPDRRLEGLYTPAGGTGPLRAVLRLAADGQVRSILVHRTRARGRVSTPRSVAAKEGDGFAPFVEVVTPGVDGAGWAATTALSTLLKLRDRPLRVLTGSLMPGDYLAGLVVQDLDGGLTRVFAPFKIRE